MKRIALSLTVAGALIAGYAGQASAGSPYAGCPPSYTQVGTDRPAAAYVDAKGNNDGVVCAKQIDDKTTQSGLPLDNFIDNSVAPNAP